MKRQRLLRFSCSLAAVLGALACSAPAVDTAPDVGLASEAIRNGTEVPDASRVGLVEISWWRQGQRCSRGSGVMLTNSMLLTAAHVVDERVRNFDCQGADELQLRMHNAGGTDEQLRVFKSGVSAGFPPIRIHPGWDAFLGILLGRIGYVFSGTDGAIVFMDWPTETDPGGPFTVNGTSSLFRRPLTANSTRANWGRTATVYGYGVNFCQSTERARRALARSRYIRHRHSVRKVCVVRTAAIAIARIRIGRRTRGARRRCSLSFKAAARARPTTPRVETC